jgi:urease accessory protein
MISLGTLLLADARLPSGAYAYSAGLEGATWDEVDRDHVVDYLRARLTTVTLVEAATCVLAYRLAEAVQQRTDRPYGFDRLQAEFDARTPLSSQRKVQSLLGRTLLRTLEKLFPEASALEAVHRQAPRPCRPIALGVAGCLLSASEAETALVCCYDEVQSCASASLKLLPTDPFETTGWVVGLGPEISAVADAACRVHHPEDIPAAGAPQMEHWTAVHAHETRRLFIA